VVVFIGILIRRRVDETPAFQEETTHGEVPKAPIIRVAQQSGPNMLRVIGMAPMNSVPVVTTTFGAAVAGPGSNVPLIVGSFTLGCAVIASIAAFSAPETYRVHLNDLGSKNPRPVPVEEYERIRAGAAA
jgi:hypothetical protein